VRRNLWLLAALTLAGVSLWAGLRAGGGDPGEGPVVPESHHLRVLNGTAEAGLARDVARRLGAAGHVVEGFANAPRPLVGPSLLVNRRLDDATARALAARLGDVAVVREWDGRCSEDAVLVLGADWSRVVAAVTPGA